MLWTELCPLKIMLKPECKCDDIWDGGVLCEMGLLDVFGMGPMRS